PYDGSFTSADLHITVLTNEATLIRLSGVYVWEGHTVYGGLSGSLVSFLGDSWTQWPPDEGSEVPLPKADGSPGEGMQYMSEYMKSIGFSNGVTFQTDNWG